MNQSILIRNKTNTNDYVKGKSTLSVDRFVKYPCQEYGFINAVLRSRAQGINKIFRKHSFKGQISLLESGISEIPLPGIYWMIYF